jgi:uncharacterized phage protein (TIGR02218 family)
MRAVSNMTLLTALAARTPMYSADLFTLSLANGVTYYYTSADQDITYSGTIWAARGPTIDRTAWGAKNTTEVPEMTVQIYSTGSDFADGQTNLKQAAINGLFDGAYLLLQRAFMPSFGDTALGTVTLFGGRVGAIDITALGLKLTCTASNVLLTQNMPRRTFQATCMHTLYDPFCTLNKASFTDSYTVASANGISVAWTAPPADPSLYLYGTMTITSGAGVGQSLTVQNTASFGVAFGYPLVTIPLVGDTFTVSQGCAKTVARCQAFGNILNYGGFPYIPSVSQGI